MIYQPSLMLLTDGYKLDHRRQYPEGTQYVYSNFTPRSSRIPSKEVVFFGLQYLLKHYFEDVAKETFFDRPKGEVIDEYKRIVNAYLGPNEIGTDHIGALHDYGRIPLEFRALPEGTRVPLRLPMFTIENTDPDFFWVTNYFETLISACVWLSCTSATIAHSYRKLFDSYAALTGTVPEFVPFEGHDFSFRGMGSPEAALLSGAAHLLSFDGTDTVPAIPFLQHYYGMSLLFGPSGVPATEHSVMCAGGEEDELATFRRLLKLYPTGILSVVSDTWDFWNVLENILPQLKAEILARNGKLVIRPDCYDDQTEILTDRGFVLFKDLSPSDLVGQYTEKGFIEFISPTTIYRESYSGDMIHFWNTKGHIDLLVTPNHRMLQRTFKGLQVVEASQAKYHSFNQHIHGGIKSGNRYLSPLERFYIAFQADGSYQTNMAKHHVRFNFAKKRKTERLIAICEDANLAYRVYIAPSRPNNTQVYVDLDHIPPKTFAWVLEQIGDLSGLWAQEFIEEVSYWDASRRSADRIKYDSTIPLNSEAIQLVASLGGYRTKYTISCDDREEHFSDVHTVHICLRDYTDGQSIQKEVQPYNGTIHCVKVPSGMVVVRRNKAVSISGNSGDPVKIVCGDPKSVRPVVKMGAIEKLWEIFGGTSTSTGYNLLDPHIGLIYGDSITLDRGDAICNGLAEKRFASGNVVFGIGSYTYQYNTRDTFGFAIKATWAQIKDQEHILFKSPKTDDGTKFSARGRIVINRNEKGQLALIDNLTLEQQNEYDYNNNNLLKTVWSDGKFFNSTNFYEVRANLKG